jgi:hypothetical protein
MRVDAAECYGTAVETAADILAKLKERGVKHAEIAKVLGVATPNATKLYNPAAKTGKPRSLGYDEAMLLIRHFSLEEPVTATKAIPLSLPVARLVVQYVASRLGVPSTTDDALVEDIAQDVQAFSEFASERPLRESESQVQGFFLGLRAQGNRSGRG